MNGVGNNHGSHRSATLVDLSELQLIQRKACLARVHNYWNALRGPRLLPLRTEIEPRAFKGALEFCFALERIAPGDARFCVAGSHLGRLMGSSVRGLPISSLLTPSCRERFAEMLDDVFGAPATASLRLRADAGPGRPPVAAWMNLLPVGDEQGETSRVIGVLVSDTDSATAPLQFSIEHATLKPLQALCNGRPRQTCAAAG